MQKKYEQALVKFSEKDAAVRDLLLRIRVHFKAGHPYYVSKEDIIKVNEARNAWLDFLKVARK